LLFKHIFNKQILPVTKTHRSYLQEIVFIHQSRYKFFWFIQLRSYSFTDGAVQRISSHR